MFRKTIFRQLIRQYWNIIAFHIEPNQNGISNFFFKKSRKFQNPSFGRTVCNIWPLHINTPSTHVRPVATVASRLILVVGRIYMDISSSQDATLNTLKVKWFEIYCKQPKMSETTPKNVCEILIDRCRFFRSPDPLRGDLLPWFFVRPASFVKTILLMHFISK